MKSRVIFFLLATALLSGCTSIFGGSSSRPQMAYIGDLSSNRISKTGETIAYAKGENDTETIIYVFKGVDGKGGIHIDRVFRSANSGGKRPGMFGLFKGKSNQSSTLVFMADQTLLVSPGVRIVFIKSTPNELHYRVIMTPA